MNTPKWVRKKSVLALHGISLRRFGGSPGLRDEGLLDSALARPEMLAHYEPDSNIHRLAAAYAFGIIQNHPFVDGNKRTGIATAYVFLRKNGYDFQAAETEIVICTLNVAAGQVSEQDLARWLTKTSRALPS